MSDALKQRLMGAAVLMIFSGLLWPLLFDFERQLQPMSAIPPMPELPAVEVLEPDPVEPELNSREALVASLPVGEGARPRLDEQGIPLAYVVQLGRFVQWENAEVLRDRLLKNKFKAYIDPPISTASGPYTVLVGPSLTKARAEATAEKIEDRLALKESIIKRFEGLQ